MNWTTYLFIYRCDGGLSKSGVHKWWTVLLKVVGDGPPTEVTTDVNLLFGFVSVRVAIEPQNIEHCSEMGSTKIP